MLSARCAQQHGRRKFILSGDKALCLKGPGRSSVESRYSKAFLLIWRLDAENTVYAKNQRFCGGFDGNLN